MSVLVPDGPVEILSAFAEQQVLDIKDGSSGEIIHAKRDEKRSTQQWQLTPVGEVGGLYYYIKQYGDGGALEAVEGPLRLAVRSLNLNNFAQQWTLLAVAGSENTCVIENRQHNYDDQVLDVEGNDPTSGGKVILWPRGADTPQNQRWKVVSRRPAVNIPVDKIVYINHLFTGLHINTQGYVGNKGVTVLMQDRNLLEYTGEAWVLENGPEGTYYINVATVFDANDNAIESTTNLSNKTGRESYKIIYDDHPGKRRRLTFDPVGIPPISEWGPPYAIDRCYPPVILDSAANTQSQCWILKPSGIMNSFSLHPVSREELVVSPRDCLVDQNTALCLLPYLYLSQLFTVVEEAF